MQKSDKKPHDDKSKAKESKATPNDKFFAGIQSSVDVFFDPEREVPRFVKTGFQSLDTALGGGIANGLTILGAKPGSGKTSLVHQIAEHISSAEIPVLYFSLEMSREQINKKNSKALPPGILYLIIYQTSICRIPKQKSRAKS